MGGWSRHPASRNGIERSNAVAGSPRDAFSTPRHSIPAKILDFPQTIRRGEHLGVGPNILRTECWRPVRVASLPPFGSEPQGRKQGRVTLPRRRPAVGPSPRWHSVSAAPDWRDSRRDSPGGVSRNGRIDHRRVTTPFYAVSYALRSSCWMRGGRVLQGVGIEGDVTGVGRRGERCRLCRFMILRCSEGQVGGYRCYIETKC